MKYLYAHTVDLVILASLNFQEFLILELFTKFRTREIRKKIKTSRILPHLQYMHHKKVKGYSSVVMLATFDYSQVSLAGLCS